MFVKASFFSRPRRVSHPIKTAYDKRGMAAFDIRADIVEIARLNVFPSIIERVIASSVGRHCKRSQRLSWYARAVLIAKVVTPSSISPFLSCSLLSCERQIALLKGASPKVSSEVFVNACARRCTPFAILKAALPTRATEGIIFFNVLRNAGGLIPLKGRDNVYVKINACPLNISIIPREISFDDFINCSKPRSVAAAEVGA
ncbi:MAG: hypothetical protein D6808_06185 [Candidatus Dadabacteria bacterium]|nr:MAG: hypothetical protein D6808_06185 [Candidatus Dadabacteria bacterium]